MLDTLSAATKRIHKSHSEHPMTERTSAGCELRVKKASTASMSAPMELNRRLRVTFRRKCFHNNSIGSNLGE